jgi:hypothetical protein
MIRAMAVGVTIILMQSAIAGEVFAKPVQWKKSEGGNNHFYEAVLVPDGIDWVEAHLAVTARGCGWHLATITSQAEDEFVFGLIANKDEFFVPDYEPVHGPWLGGFQRNSTEEPDGQWRWVTSEAFEYTNWGAGEPNNSDSEDFLHYKRVNFGLGDQPAWNDVNANILFSGNVQLPGYIAELEVPRPKFCSRSE